MNKKIKMKDLNKNLERSAERNVFRAIENVNEISSADNNNEVLETRTKETERLDATIERLQQKLNIKQQLEDKENYGQMNVTIENQMDSEHPSKKHKVEHLETHAVKKVNENVTAKTSEQSIFRDIDLKMFGKENDTHRRVRILNHCISLISKPKNVSKRYTPPYYTETHTKSKNQKE